MLKIINARRSVRKEGPRAGLVILFLCLLVAGGPRISTAGQQNNIDTSGATAETVVQADLAGQVNPEGLMLSVGLYRRWIQGRNSELGLPSSYVQSGFGIATTPAYGRASFHVEWLPVIFAKLRLQYDWYRYYGTNSALLSFPSADSPFGRHDIEAREGTEEVGYGSRVLIRPTLYAKAGPVIISNQTDLAYFHINGTGPYFLEWTYETLIKDRDHVVQNRTNVLVEAWKGTGDASLLVGPYYEITQAAAADLTRQFLGVMAYWASGDALSSFKRPRLFAQIARYVQDRNRRGEITAAIGVGFDLDL